MRAKGKKVQIVPPHLVADGISAVRTLFPTIRIDKDKCSVGIDCLRHYRYEIVDLETGGFTSEPVHDIFSHGADSLRYACVALRHAKEIKHDPAKFWNASPFRGDSGAWAGV